MPPVAMLHDEACEAVAGRAIRLREQQVIVYSVDLGPTSLTYPFSRETFGQREDAERFIEDVRGDDPELAGSLRIEERELGVRGLN